MNPAPNQVAIDLAEIKGQLSQLSEIKAALLTIQNSLSGFREEYIREHAVLEASVNKAHSRIDTVYTEIDDIKSSLDEIKTLVPIIRMFAWAMGGILLPLLVGVVVWVWSLITHGGLVLP